MFSYEAGATLKSTGATRVCRAAARDGRSTVILKEPAQKRPAVSVVERLRREWRLGQKLHIPGLRRPIELIDSPDRICLVLEDVGGRPLSRVLDEGPLTVLAALRLGMSIARTLAGLHCSGIAHGDVSPANIIVGGRDERPWLIDLGLAHRLTEEGRQPGWTGGTLAYIAPERTGRTGHLPDSRSDLYGLGVTLYHAMIGRPPFAATDHSALLRAHLTVQPTPPSAVSRAIPETLSAVVMKLLAKRPSDRYAGALGVMLDLDHVASSLLETGEVGGFELARRDPPCRPLLPGHLHGRDEALGVLGDALQSARSGRSRLVCVTGRSGSGKSALVARALTAAVASGARIGYGKADGLNRAPLGCLTQVLSDLVRILLAANEAELPLGESSLQTALGPTANRIAALVPRLELITGRTGTEPSAATGAEARNQLMLGVRRLLGLLASPAHPVILYMDDTQWADPQGVGLIEQLLEDASLRHVLVVFAFRDGELAEDHPLLPAVESIRLGGTPVDRIRLDYLGRADCAAMIGDMLGVAAVEVDALAGSVHSATLGLPLTVQRTIFALHEQDRLHLDVSAEAWRWDTAYVETLGVRQDLASLTSANAAELPAETRALLTRAACLGTSFRVSRLASAGAMPVERVRALLALAVAQRLVAPVSEEGQEAPNKVATYRFLHDQLRDEAVAGLTPDEKAALHLEIGRRLEASQGPREDGPWLFDVVRQFNLGGGLVRSDPTRLRIARLGLRAGRLALQEVAHARAADLLEQAISWLPTDAWFIEPELCRSLHHAAADASILVGRPARAQVFISALDGHVEPGLERAEVCVLEIRRRVMASDHAGAIGSMLETLAELGVSCADDREAWDKLAAVELGRIQEIVGSAAVTSFVAAPPARDREVQREAAILHTVAPVSSLVPHISAAVIGRMTRLALEHGPTPHSPYAYVLFGMLQVRIGDARQGLAFGELALALNQLQERPALEAPLHHIFGTFVCHWTRPYDEALRHVLLGFECGVDYGVFDTAGWAAMNVVPLGFARGAELPWLAELGKKQFDVSRGVLRYDDASLSLAFGQHLVASLRADRDRTQELEADGFPFGKLDERLGHYPMLRATLSAAALQRDVILGDLESARERLRFLSDPAVAPLITTMCAEAEIALYDSLVRVLTEPAASDTEVHLRRNAERLRGWSVTAPANHLYKQLLVEAELASLSDDESAALDLFERAADAADAHGILHGAALALERTAAHHARRGRNRLVLAYLRDARDAWARWGADARVRQLQRQHPELRRPTAWQSRSHTLVDEFDRPDVQDLVRAVEGLTGPGQLSDSLVRAGLEISGAQRCVLLSLNGKELEVSSTARASDSGHGLAPRTDGPLTTPDDALPWQPIHFALRTGSQVLLADALADPTFGADPTVLERSIRSIACLPLSASGAPFGVLYLEHGTATHAFTAERAALLQSVTTLAATAFENAELIEKQTAVSERLGAMVDDRSRELEKLYRDHMLILDSVGDAIIWVDATGVLSYANPAASRITAIPGAQLVGAHADSVFRCFDVELESHNPDTCLLCQNQPPNHRSAEATLRRVDGQPIHIEWRGQPVEDDDGEPLGTLIVVRDCTQRIQLEKQLRHVQKMEAVGQFAGGLAHDFNNLLTPIVGYVDMIALKLGPHHPQAHALRAVASASERAAALVRQMLAFSRRGELFAKPTDLVAVVDEVLTFTARSIDRTITLTWSPASARAWVQGDSGQLGQVLLNLLVNARDALEDRPIDDDGAQIRVAVDDVVIDDPELLGHPEAPSGHYVRLSVEDNGVGMSPETASRVFDPFFSTKGVGKGSGLGLSVAYGIVESHGGWILCRSELGRGTTFTLWLPATEPPEPAPAPPVSPVAPAESRARLLVVDDEPIVRKLAVIQLTSLGYDVVVAVNGQQALEIFREQRGQLDAIILDLSMPVMGGEEALRRLRLEDTRIPVLLWSGYDLIGSGESATQMGAQAALRKPYRLAELDQALRALLAGQGSARSPTTEPQG